MLNDDLYPTRGTQERLSERKDPVLYGWDHCRKRLTEPELLDYEKHGFVIIPDVFTPTETATLRARIPDLRQQAKKTDRPHPASALPVGEHNSLLAPETASNVFQNLARDRRILDRIRQIVGSSLYLHRSRIHIEGKGGGGSYPWHSEFETWHAEDGVPRMRGVEVWIMLHDSNSANGCMRALAKSHYLYAACPGGDASAETANNSPRPGVETLTRLLYFGERIDIHGQPGTLVICDSNLMYASTSGTSRRNRATVMLSYNSVQNLPVGRPFAGKQLRPPPIVNHDHAALKPASFDLATC